MKAGSQSQAAGDKGRRKILIADYNHVARYPAPNSPGKLAAYRRSQELFLKAARYFDPPVERIEMPFQGRSVEGAVSVGLLRRRERRPPLVVLWGGIDAFKKSSPASLMRRRLGVTCHRHAALPARQRSEGRRTLVGRGFRLHRPGRIRRDHVWVHGGSTGGCWGARSLPIAIGCARR
jgi:hypothetical protein